MDRLRAYTALLESAWKGKGRCAPQHTDMSCTCLSANSFGGLLGYGTSDRSEDPCPDAWVC